MPLDKLPTLSFEKLSNSVTNASHRAFPDSKKSFVWTSGSKPSSPLPIVRTGQKNDPLFRIQPLKFHTPASFLPNVSIHS